MKKTLEVIINNITIYNTAREISIEEFSNFFLFIADVT
jgi:hypothetical protein